MSNGWTPARRAKQAEMIRQWQPWTRPSTASTPRPPRASEPSFESCFDAWQACCARISRRSNETRFGGFFHTKAVHLLFSCRQACTQRMARKAETIAGKGIQPHSWHTNSEYRISQAVFIYPKKAPVRALFYFP